MSNTFLFVRWIKINKWIWNCKSVFWEGKTCWITEISERSKWDWWKQYAIICGSSLLGDICWEWQWAQIKSSTSQAPSKWPCDATLARDINRRQRKAPGRVFALIGHHFSLFLPPPWLLKCKCVSGGEAVNMCFWDDEQESKNHTWSRTEQKVAGSLDFDGSVTLTVMAVWPWLPSCLQTSH